MTKHFRGQTFNVEGLSIDTGYNDFLLLLNFSQHILDFVFTNFK